MVSRTAFLAFAMLMQPDPGALAPLYRKNLEQREKQYGPDHPKVARAASDLGLFLRAQGQPAAAEPYLRRALDIDRKTATPAATVIAEDLENLASVLSPERGIPLLREAAAHPDPVISARNLATLASIAEKSGDPKSALALYKQALTKEEAALPLGPRVAVRLIDIALLEQPPAAEPLLKRAVAIQEKALGANHPEVATTLINLSSVLLTLGRPTAAEPLARRALSILETLGPRNPRLASANGNLADILRTKKDYPSARRHYQAALAIDERAYGPNHPEVAADLENLAGLLEAMGQKSEAEKLRQRAAAIPRR